MRPAPPHPHASGAVSRARVAADRCPTAVKLHPAADGLIARVRLPGGRVTPEQALMLAGWVTADQIEITGRGNLQLRGLSAEQAGPLAAALHGAGLLPSEPHDQARTIVASPLAGRLPGAAPIDDLVRAIDVALCADPALTALSGRFLIAVDDGTGAVRTGRADIALRRLPLGSLTEALDERVLLTIGGTAAGTVALADAPAAVIAAARTFLEQAAGAAWQVRELADGGAGVVLALVASGLTQPFGPGGPRTPRGAPQAEPLPLGPGRQTDGRGFVRAIAPLGRLTAAQLKTAASLAALAGTELRLSGDRSLTIPDVPQRFVTPTADRLAAAGLMLSPTNPGVGLTACAGLGCASSRGDVRAAAALRQADRRPGAPREHLVGCDRRCGAPPGPAGFDATFVLADGESPQSFADRIALATAESPRRTRRGGGRRTSQETDR